jgi:GNAT superfamily N-acetyltransferase
MIRLARPSDVDDIASLGLEFAEKSQLVHTFEPSLSKIWEAIYIAAFDSRFILMVAEVDGKIGGFILGLILAPIFSEEVVLQEMGMYVRKGFNGLLLLNAFEEEARIRGIKKVVVGCKPDFCDLGNYYKRKGYRLLETQYLKEL